MTLKFFPRIANAGPPTVTGSVSIRTAAALGTDYEYTDSINVVGLAEVVVELAWNQADETSLEMTMQTTDDGPETVDGSATWKEITGKDTPSAGVSAVYPEVLSLANASFPDPNAISLPPIDVTGLERVRFGFKKTGGASAVTLGVTARAGQLAIAR